jgi:hypothetical protein
MSDGITYCPAFHEDAVFGAMINSFQFRWTSSCIANPENQPEDMLKSVLHALASSKRRETPFLVVLILTVWYETPWISASIRDHRNISTLVHIPIGHVQFVPAHRQSDDTTATLHPAKWPVEIVLISNEAGREKYLDRSKIH